MKTVYIEYGSTTEIVWKNTAVRGQIQIVKKSADYNPANGLPAGTLLEGAVFEIYDKAGNVEAPMLYCTAISTLTAGSSFVNVADVGGIYRDRWIQAVTRWVTTVYGKPVTLPRTGY